MKAFICGGLAEYFGIDSVIVRLVFVVLVFFSGLGLLIIATVFLAWNGYPAPDTREKTGARMEGASHGFARTSKSTICPDARNGPCW